MRRKKNDGAGFVPGVLAAICWGTHFPLLLNRVSAATDPLVFYFHCVFWAAIASMTLLTLLGRTDELSLISSRSGTIFMLVLTGGYGLWMLLATAFRIQPDGGHDVELVFYSGPVVLAFFSLFTRGGSRQVRLGPPLVGLAGVILIIYGIGGLETPGLRVFAFAAGAAVIWAVFSILSYSLLRRFEVLPALVLMLCVSTVCLFLTSLIMRIDVLAIDRGDIWVSILVGTISIAMGLGLWMKCMSGLNMPSKASTLWYGAPILSVFLYGYFDGAGMGWASFAGIIVILFSFKSGGKPREKTETTFGDMLSGR